MAKPKKYKSQKQRRAGSRDALYGTGPVDAAAKSLRRRLQKTGGISRTGGGGTVVRG